MPYDLRVVKIADFVRLDADGHFDKDASRRALEHIAKTCIGRGICAARIRGLGVVAFLGRGGGALRALVDEAIVIPSDDSSRIQEMHLALEHLIVEAIEAELEP